jgi:cell division septation protein DedD
MEDDKKKTKEYYQVNLDTGRIFWIVFILGIIVIGIFFFGLYLGRDKDEQKLFGFDSSKLFGKKITIDRSMEKAPEESPLLRLIEEDLDEESRYIEIEDIQAPAQEIEGAEAEDTGPKVQKVSPEMTKAVSPKVSPKVSAPRKKEVVVTKAPAAPKKRYIARGNYYIQVASFVKEENAHSLAEDLEKRLYKVVIEKAEIEEKTFYRVRVGPFESEGVATNTMTAMKRKYDLKDPFVVKKRS